MATTTKTRAPRNLKPADVLAAEAAAAAQTAAQISNSAAIASAIQTIVDAYQGTVEAVKTAEQARLTKLEQTYVALSDIAAKHELNYTMSQELLTKALGAYYPEADFKIAVSTASKLRSQLLRAMHPNVRGKFAAIVAPWEAAWDAETAAKAADPKAATPLRDKFDNRGGTITQALKLAMGKTDSKGKVTETPVVCAAPDDVLTWVTAHPRVKRGATTPAGTTPATVAAKAAASAGAGLSAPDAASAKVDALIAAVKAVSSEYGDPDCFVAVLEALGNCTATKMIRKPASEPVRGVADIDDAINPDWADLAMKLEVSYAQVVAMKTKSGK